MIPSDSCCSPRGPLVAAVLLFILGSFAIVPRTRAAPSFEESDWHTAFNDKVTHGQVEVEIPTGRIDILTDTYAIEVDRVRNYREGMKQALQYAAATKREAGLALYMDGAADTLQALDEALAPGKVSGPRYGERAMAMVDR